MRTSIVTFTYMDNLRKRDRDIESKGEREYGEL